MRKISPIGIRVIQVALAIGVMSGLYLWLLASGKPFDFITDFNGQRLVLLPQSPLISSMDRQPTAVYVFKADPASIRKAMNTELKRRGWTDLSIGERSRVKDWSTTFARTEKYRRTRSWDRDVDEWIDIGSSYYGTPYPTGTTCVVAIHTEPGWFEQQLDALSARLAGSGP